MPQLQPSLSVGIRQRAVQQCEYQLCRGDDDADRGGEAPDRGGRLSTHSHPLHPTEGAHETGLSHLTVMKTATDQFCRLLLLKHRMLIVFSGRCCKKYSHCRCNTSTRRLSRSGSGRWWWTSSSRTSSRWSQPC